MENEEENETMLEKMKEIIAEQLNVDVMDYLKAKGVEG